MTVFSGMEAINIKENIEQEVTQEDITPILFDLIDNESSLAEDLSQIDQMLIDEEKFNTAFEQLMILSDSIEEFGLSKGVIKAVDPDGYLEANGIVPAYEELNDLPTKNEKAEAALESISDVLSKALKKIKEFMVNLWNKMKLMFKKFIQLFQSYDSILSKQKSILSQKTKFNSKKVDIMKFKLVNKTDLQATLDFFQSDAIKLLDLIYEYTTVLEKKFAKSSDQASFDTKDAINQITKKLTDVPINNKFLKYGGFKIISKNNIPVTKKQTDLSVFSKIKSKTIKEFEYNSIQDIDDIINKAMISVNTKKEYHIFFQNIFNEYLQFYAINAQKYKSISNKYQRKKIIENFKLISNLVSFCLSFCINLFMKNNKSIRLAIVVINSALSISE